MTTNMPISFDVATGDVRLCGAIAEIDELTGRAVSIERVEVQGETSEQAYDADDKAPPAPRED
jgi:2',3'-cyclic-nucleotide 2'-phosphodiesterase